MLALYERRFWCEPGFRNDKRKGWQWEASQVQGVAHHERLLVGMAWASLVTLVVGVEAAAAAVARLAERARRRHGRRCATRAKACSRWGCGRCGTGCIRRRAVRCAGSCRNLDAPSWEQQWYHYQASRLIFGQPVRP